MGSARKAFYLGRREDARQIAAEAEAEIEWFCDRPAPQSESEVVVAIQWDEIGLKGRRSDLDQGSFAPVA
jgi:hypothetical protein